MTITFDDQDTNSVRGASSAGNEAEKNAYLAKARDAGWNETTAFDYSAFQQSGGANAPAFAAAARVYEWTGDVGDVGPEVLELEHLLFGSEYQMKKGTSIQNITSFNVSLEGEVKIAPVRRVGPSRNLLQFESTDRAPVRRRRPPSRCARQCEALRIR